MSVLAAHGFGFEYPACAMPALEDVDLEIEAGTVTLLAGPSGGGKTTLMRALSGAIPHLRAGRMRGRVELRGVDTRQIPPARLGLEVGLLFQDPEAQAVMAGAWRDVAFAPQNAGRSPSAIAADVDWALAAMGASHLAGRRIDELSSGERQRIALAGVLAARPRVLLLDEPTSQLDGGGTAALVRLIPELAGTGTALVISEHRTERLGGLADRTVGVVHGRLAPPPDPPSPARPDPRSGGQSRARLLGVTAGYRSRTVLHDCDIDLRAGTVTVLTGPNGSGKTTLLRVLAGLHAAERGVVDLEGRDVTALPIERRVPEIGFLPQDPGRHLLTESVAHEIEHALRARRSGRSERRRARETAIEVHGLAALADQHPHDLSVGERERVALAGILASVPGVLLLDEPTRGMDPARKRDLVAQLRSAAAAGAAVLVATHDDDFAVGVADARLVLVAGRVESDDRVEAQVAT